MKPGPTRYSFTAFITSINNDRLYKGEDLTLNRSVFIYAVPIQNNTSVEAYIQKLNKAVPGLTNPPFMHVLDIEIQQEQIHIILNYKAGCSLRQFIQTASPSLAESLAIIAAFGQALLTAAEESSVNFAMTPDNIWITDERKINAINTWDGPEFNQSLSKALSLLLYQLITRTDDVPTNADSFATQLSWSLPHCPPAMKEEIVTAVTHAWNEQLALTSFVPCIISLLEDHGEGWQEEHNFHPGTTRFTPPYEPLIEGNDESVPSRSTLLFRLSKKAILGLSATIAGLAVFAGVLMLLIESIDLKGTPSTPPVSVAREQQPEPTPSTKPSPNQPTITSGTTSPDNQSTALVPILTGLTKETAEKMALDAGLRYTFYLEVHDQAAGTVFKQEPQPNERVTRGSRVTFWISKGR